MVKRYIVWSPRIQNCMAWENRDMAERLAEFWRYAAMLGSRDWRVSLLADGPADTDAGASPPASARMPQSATRADAANDPAAVTREDLLDLLASKDALIDRLQRKLNDNTLSSVREAAAQSRRIAELEQQVVSMSRGRTGNR